MIDKHPQDTSLNFGITGMSCAGCASRAEKVLKGIEGVADARVDFATERAHVNVAVDRASVIAMATEEAGFVPETTAIDLDIAGMTCAGCANAVEKALANVPGVISASVNLALEQARVTWLGTSLSVDGLVQATNAAGYQATPRATQAEVRREQERLKSEADAHQLKSETRMLTIAAALTTPLLLMMVLPTAGYRLSRAGVGAGLIVWTCSILDWCPILYRRVEGTKGQKRQHGCVGGAGYIGGFCPQHPGHFPRRLGDDCSFIF